MIYATRNQYKPFNKEIGNSENADINKDYWAFAYEEDELKDIMAQGIEKYCN